MVGYMVKYKKSGAIFLTEGFVNAFSGIVLKFILIPHIVTALDGEYRKSLKKVKS